MSKGPERFAIFNLDGDSWMVHPETKEPCKHLCFGGFMVRFSDPDAMMGHLWANDFGLRAEVYDTLILPALEGDRLDLEEAIRHGGYYYNGNYSVLCSRLNGIEIN